MLALGLGGFGIGTTEFVTMGLLPDIAAAFGISEPTAGHAVSAYALGVVVGAPLIAALCARVPRKKLLIALMAAFPAHRWWMTALPIACMAVVAAWLWRRPEPRQ